MSGSQFIVKGEASESESDDEVHGIDKKPTVNVIDGEASESDGEESSTTTPSPFSADLSLLQCKLVATNVSLYANLKQIVQQTIQKAHKDLLASDLMLQKSQLSLQSASKSIKNVTSNTEHLLNKTQNVISSDFLSNVKIA